MLLVRKDGFLSFLDENDLSLIWTINGEKMVTNKGSLIFKRRMDITGAYTLDNDNSIFGEQSFDVRQ
jgi:hypothetical protein